MAIKKRSLSVAKRFRKKLLKTRTKSEIEFEKRLKELGIKYETQYIVFVSDTRFFILDFFFSELNWGCEIDGSWHTLLKTKKRDKWRTKLLLTKVEKVIRIKNKDIWKINLEKIQNPAY